MDSINEFDKIAETLWDACYDATWCDFAYTGKVSRRNPRYGQVGKSPS
ncbi:MAG TPA: hypothetical protein VLX29_00075 [Nitrospirota bacterium]|nr:hypothetical protein [Nitrospirota bacterium]